MGRLNEIFDNKKIVKKIQKKLPYLFALAEKDASRGGKLGMEIGSVRERILCAMLMSIFGRDNISTDIPITKPEVDVILFGEPISIKTLTGAKTSGIKAIWTVDWDKQNEFVKNYNPVCDILFVQLNWNRTGGFFYFPLKAQNEIFKKMGRDKYFKIPPRNTNPRGVEFSSDTINQLFNHNESKSFEIEWVRPKIEYDTFEKWISAWEEIN